MSIYIVISATIVWDMRESPKRTCSTALGCSTFFSCTGRLLKKISILSDFIPPDVEPEQPHWMER